MFYQVDSLPSMSWNMIEGMSLQISKASQPQRLFSLVLTSDGRDQLVQASKDLNEVEYLQYSEDRKEKIELRAS